MLWLPAAVNLAMCLLFIAVREPHIAFLSEREEAWQRGGFQFVSSSDPWMYIAGRPLYHWTRWHHGESLAVRVLQVANWPALITAKRIGDGLAPYARRERLLSFSEMTWLYGWLFIGLASAQWLLVGVLLRLFASRPRARRAAADP